MRTDSRLLWQVTRLMVLGLGAIASLMWFRVSVPQARAQYCPNDGCSNHGGQMFCDADTNMNYESCGLVGKVCTNGPPCPPY
jgi:hypothetical protein